MWERQVLALELAARAWHASRLPGDEQPRFQFPPGTWFLGPLPRLHDFAANGAAHALVLELERAAEPFGGATIMQGVRALSLVPQFAIDRVAVLTAALQRRR